MPDTNSHEEDTRESYDIASCLQNTGSWTDEVKIQHIAANANRLVHCADDFDEADRLVGAARTYIEDKFENGQIADTEYHRFDCQLLGIELAVLSGRARVTSFRLADAMLKGRREEANACIDKLRAYIEGVDPEYRHLQECIAPAQDR